ncbi:MAG: serine/threonine protein kinase [Gemmataceae bacterium]|nr:serine/threonine protein kinase [Gemmataceae bacterium]
MSDQSPERQVSTVTEGERSGQLDRDPTCRSDPPGAPTLPDPALPTTPWIPGFENLGELGRGGMGVVYRARDLALKRLVAVKMVLGTQTTDEGLARFQTESEAVARLEHPHIVRILTSGQYQGQPYFVMEYVEGKSLSRTVQGQPQSPADAARLIQLLARAVHYAHQKGIVHRDLKPANVLLAPPADEPALNAPLGCPKITDFGLAKRLDEDATLTATGAVLGTPDYMAPEQAGTGGQIGPATDVWALGVILYELLTGRRPFKAASQILTLLQVCQRQPEPPSQLRPGLPASLEAVCLRCLQKESHRRYPSAAALADDLGRFLEGKSVRPPPPETPGPPQPPRPPGQARRWRLKLAALLLVGVLVWAFWPFGSGNDAPPQPQPQDIKLTVSHGFTWHNVYATNQTGEALGNVKGQLTVTFHNGAQDVQEFQHANWLPRQELKLTWYTSPRGRVRQAEFTCTAEVNGVEKRFTGRLVPSR